jgi:DNA-binding MarR family transcriptional regulator
MPTGEGNVASERFDRTLPASRRLAAALSRLDVHRRYVEQRSPLGIAHARLLWLLSDGRPRTLREIGDALRLEQSTVNRQVNGALKDGLLRRVAVPGAPARVLEPTASGTEAFESVTANALAAYAGGLAALGEEADVFLELLERFVAAYGDAMRTDGSD